MGRLILVTGGVRSGKSSYAVKRASNIAPADGGHRVVFVATAQPSDEEMRQRIQRHQQERPSNWVTVEAPLDAADRVVAASRLVNLIILDCITLLASNLLFSIQGQSPTAIEARLDAEIEKLCTGVKAGQATTIIVTNEVGLGIIPSNALARLYGDLMGRANQQLAASADELILMVCGVPMHVRGTVPAIDRRPHRT